METKRSKAEAEEGEMKAQPKKMTGLQTCSSRMARETRLPVANPNCNNLISTP